MKSRRGRTRKPERCIGQLGRKQPLPCSCCPTGVKHQLEAGEFRHITPVFPMYINRCEKKDRSSSQCGYSATLPSLPCSSSTFSTSPKACTAQWGSKYQRKQSYPCVSLLAVLIMGMLQRHAEAEAVALHNTPGHLLGL